MELALLSNLDIVQFIDTSGIFPAIIIILLTFGIMRISKYGFNQLGEQYTQYRLTIKQISVLVQFLLLFGGGFFSFSRLLMVSQDGISLLIGLLALGLSWSSKDLIASLMAGITLLMDRPFQVGDRISFAGYYGEVIEIGLRTVRLVDLEDNLISIPNNLFLQGLVSSANAGALDQMCVFRFYVGCNQDYRLAEKIVQEAVVSSPYVFWQKPVSIFMKEAPVPDGAERFAIHITAKAYVFDGRYESHFISDVHRRVKQAFRKHNIYTAGDLEWQKLNTETQISTATNN